MFKHPFRMILFILVINIYESIDWEKYIKGTELKAKENGIDSLVGIENYNFLAYIQLRSNRIENINVLKSFVNLTYLDLSSNKRIRSIDCLSKLVKLKYIFLSFNEIEKMQPVCDLYNLEALYLYRNKIKQLKSLEKLTKL